MRVVHFAASGTTACGRGIYGTTAQVSEEYGYDCNFSDPSNVQHACDPDLVTCETCQKTKAFKDAKAGVA